MLLQVALLRNCIITMQKEDLGAIFKNINGEWLKVIKSNDLKPLLVNALTSIKSTSTDVICPKYNEILECFRYRGPQDTKVVIMGQDPYYGPGEAHGLAFSVKNGNMPPSLRNIKTAIYNSCNQRLESGNLSHWAEQGVLLLNARLTTELGTPCAVNHKHWESFTNKLIEWIDVNIPGVIFVLWGNFAKNKSKFINNGIVMTYTHPSPLADKTLRPQYKFANCKHFKEINDILTARGCDAIKWGERSTSGIDGGIDGGIIDDAANSTDASNTANNPSQCSKLLKDCVDNVVFVDGACHGNGKTTAKASYGFCFKRGPLEGYSEAKQLPSAPIPTNNRGELLAIINALKHIENNVKAVGNTTRIRIVSDSRYCIGIFSEWLDNWVKKGTVEDMKNPDLLNELLSIKKSLIALGFEFTIQYYPSHTPEPNNKDSEDYFLWYGNFMADKLATEAIN